MQHARPASMVIIFSAALACNGGSLGPDRSGTFSFALHGLPGQFVAQTSDPLVLEKARAQLRLPRQQRDLFINGPVARGHGDHNLDWSWHFVPGEWDLVEASIEVCDGTPDALEADLDRWLEEVGHFCPWQSYVAEEL